MVEKYKVEDKHLGARYDGGRSPLGTPVSIGTKEEFKKALRGISPEAEGYVASALREWGYDPERICELRGKRRQKLINKIEREIERENELIYQSVLQQVAEFGVESLSPGYVRDVPGGGLEFKGHIAGESERGELPRSFLARDDAARRERTALHVRLRQWAAGPLVLERPTGSSLHHLADYDRGIAMDKQRISPFGEWFEDCQIVVVENDWGAAVPQIDGEWRVPFAVICWEFRISGVRVLAFTEADREPNQMWCVYGADGHWVVDDYRYELGCAALPRGIPKKGVDPHEFRRVAKMCYDTIRASCIMLDAQVARHEHVPASAKLKQKRAAERRSALRDHYVVRLLHNEQRAHVRARSAGGAVGLARALQRGHWRKGAWVHYDDPDSGQVQYPNDGGFVVSKTWRRWHFAGDPRNIIHKEYRL